MCKTVTNVHVNVDKIQSILPHEEPTICIFLKWRLEYKSPYILGNVYPNMMMFYLWYFIETIIQGFEYYHSPSIGI